MAFYSGIDALKHIEVLHRSPLSQPPADGVHRLFEAQAARVPEVCAVTCGEHGLTYRELDRRANGFARHLRTLGVGADVLVGICLPRSVEAVIVVLAVLKAGGAYLPLDPAYPAERLAFMLENSGAPVLVTDPAVWGSHEAAAKTPAGLRTVYLQGSQPNDGHDDGQNDDAAPVAAADSSDRLAYVIYTSGSTGRPKGVAMPHRPLLNLLAWQARVCPLAAGSRVLQFAPLSFDVSFQEMFSTLGAGGTLALVSEELRRDPRGLLRFLAEEDIARVFLPPVMLYQLAEQLVDSDFVPSSLREVITAGEALRITPAVARFFARLGAGCTLHNHYGPTETHVVTAHALAGDPDGWPALPPIGQPIDGAHIHLLDDHGQPVTEGEPGGLFIGGDCLARGYLHDPELTGAKFIEKDGARLYKTGDLAQRLPDGDLQYLGRADDQVKIRGFRIELGEIEAVLSHHPAVRETAVGVAPDEAGMGQELVGYFVSRAAQSAPAAADLRRWLLERLPDYMVPTHFASLAQLPLTPSGKVDRRALPRYRATRAEAKTTDAAPPATPLEKIIARLWEETLNLKNPGVRDNFFEVGGNSLHAVKVHTKLCQALQREFPITALFQHPTISALAGYLGVDPDKPAAGNSLLQNRAQLQQQAAAAARARMATARK